MLAALIVVGFILVLGGALLLATTSPEKQPSQPTPSSRDGKTAEILVAPTPASESTPPTPPKAEETKPSGPAKAPESAKPPEPVKLPEPAATPTPPKPFKALERKAFSPDSFIEAIPEKTKESEAAPPVDPELESIKAALDNVPTTTTKRSLETAEVGVRIKRKLGPQSSLTRLKPAKPSPKLKPVKSGRKE